SGSGTAHVHPRRGDAIDVQRLGNQVEVERRKLQQAELIAPTIDVVQRRPGAALQRANGELRRVVTRPEEEGRMAELRLWSLPPAVRHHRLDRIVLLAGEAGGFDEAPERLRLVADVFRRAYQFEEPGAVRLREDRGQEADLRLDGRGLLLGRLVAADPLFLLA